MEKELICIGCPLGCALKVKVEGSDITVTGNTCPRGESYARKEMTNPTRIVTTTVKVLGGSRKLVSVKTKTDIPKKKITECMKALKSVSVQAPVYIGEVVLANVADTGIDVVATKTVLL